GDRQQVIVVPVERRQGDRLERGVIPHLEQCVCRREIRQQPHVPLRQLVGAERHVRHAAELAVADAGDAPVQHGLPEDGQLGRGQPRRRLPVHPVHSRQDEQGVVGQRGWRRTGTWRRPVCLLLRVHSGGPVISALSTRSSRALNTRRISMRARAAPRQKCTPWPNVTCGLGVRVMSNRNGSANTASSRFADAHHNVTLSPAPIVLPPTSTSRVAVRRLYGVDEPHRSISSTAVVMRLRSACSRRHWSGCWISAIRPAPIELRVVSLPAAISRLKNICCSSRVVPKGACTTADSRSSAGHFCFSSISRPPYTYC